MTSVQNRRLRLSGNKLLFIGLCALTLAACSKKSIPKHTIPKPQPVHKPKEPAKENEPFKKPTEKPTISKPPRGSGSKAGIPTISLLLPFNTAQVDLENANNKAAFKQSDIALDFYQGFRIGIDSATKVGKGIKLQVFDSLDDSLEVRHLANDPNLMNSNLIVGPLFPSEIKAFSSLAIASKKYFVSPLSPRIVVENNPYLIVPVSPLEVHAQKMADFLIKGSEAKRIIIVKGPDSDDENFVNPFKDAYDAFTIGMTITEQRITANNFSPLLAKLEKEKNNYLLISSANKAFWEALFKFLDKNKTYSTSLIAYPGSERLMTSLGWPKVNARNIYFTTSYHVDKSDQGTKAFFDQYKLQYGLEPNESAIKGFDIGYFFAKLITQFPNDYQKHLDKFYRGIHNNFRFSQTENGFLNESIRVIKVDNSKFIEQK